MKWLILTSNVNNEPVDLGATWTSLLTVGPLRIAEGTGRAWNGSGSSSSCLWLAHTSFLLFVSRSKPIGFVNSFAGTFFTPR